MKKLPNIITTVSLDSIGELTKTRWLGQFTIKCVLTHADRFELERIYARLLPPLDREINETVKIRAAAIAELSVRVMNGPSWWEGSKGGQLLIDETPIFDLALLCNQEEKRWAEQLEQLSQTEESNAVPVSKPN